MARKIVFAWGRFNPPTTGHKVVMDRVAKEARTRKADYAIFASKSNDPKKNPLTFRTKVKFLKQSFPKHAKNINASPRLKTVLDVMKSLDKKYQEVSLVVGADRAQEFKKLLNHYNGREYDFEEIEIISAGERDPDADDVTGMSASKMRKAAAEGDYTSFRKGSPMKNSRELYNAIRRGMKINEEIYHIIESVHDRQISGRRFNQMLRFGLVATRHIPITQRAFKDLEKSGPNPELREYIYEVIEKVLEYVMADDLLYRRFLMLLHNDFLMKEDHRDALLTKAEKSQLSYTSLLEVFLRGLAASPIYGDKTAHQHAFDRVNSYVAGGHSRKTLDADIWESSQQKNIGRNSMKRLRDIKPPEWGTKEMADRYSKVTPGQPDDTAELMVSPHEIVHETAPPGVEAEAFIKDNKNKFKKRYGDKWEQVLYATAWKVYGKKESVDEEVDFAEGKPRDPKKEKETPAERETRMKSSFSRVRGKPSFNDRQKAFASHFYNVNKRKPNKQELRAAGVGKGGDNPAGEKVWKAKMAKLKKGVSEDISIDEAVDKSTVRELVLYITNDAQIYRQRITPIIKNLSRKVGAATYDGNKAIKAFMYAVTDGLKKYEKEHATRGWARTIDKKTKEAIAEELLEYYSEQIGEETKRNSGVEIEEGTTQAKKDRLAKIARAAAAREKDQAKEKEKATAKHHRASAKSRASHGYITKDQFGRPLKDEVEIEEGGMGKGDTKASKELNLQKGGQKWVGRDKSLKPEKKAAHKAERSRGKKDIKKFKEFSEASFMVDIEGLGKVVIDGKSAGEIKASLRKKLRIKDDLRSVERVGVAAKKKHFIAKATGKEETKDEE